MDYGGSSSGRQTYIVGATVERKFHQPFSIPFQAAVSKQSNPDDKA